MEKLEKDRKQRMVLGQEDKDFPTDLVQQINNIARPRFAFLVGIGEAYDEKNRLFCPVNDVTDLAEKLEHLGFQCIQLVEKGATINNVKRNFEHFLKLVLKSDKLVADEGHADLSVVMFYFSGHGSSNKSADTLCLVDGHLECEWFAERLSKRKELPGHDEDRVKKERRTRYPSNIVVLDCCRPRKHQYNKLPEYGIYTTMIQSCRCSQSSYEPKSGRNGMFTAHLLANLTTGLDQDLPIIFGKVKAGVGRQHGGLQVPIVNDVLSIPVILVTKNVERTANKYIRQEVKLLKENYKLWDVVVEKFDSRGHGFFDAGGQLLSEFARAVTNVFRGLFS
jgi:hypothetical protein